MSSGGSAPGSIAGVDLGVLRSLMRENEEFAQLSEKYPMVAEMLLADAAGVRDTLADMQVEVRSTSETGRNSGGEAQGELEHRDVPVSEKLLGDTVSDGSSRVCDLCGDVVATGRWEAHISLWCSALESSGSDEERGSRSGTEGIVSGDSRRVTVEDGTVVSAGKLEGGVAAASSDSSPEKSGGDGVTIPEHLRALLLMDKQKEGVEDDREEQSSGTVSASSSFSRTFRVECVGDSLTEGYYGEYPSLQFHPYSDILRRSCEAEFGPRQTQVLVRNSGVSGESSAEIAHRVASEVVPKYGRGTPLDVAILLGGTNDLVDCSPREIVDNLTTTIALLQEAGAVVVSLSVPEHGIEQTQNSLAERTRRTRAAVNAELSQFCMANGIVFVDISSFLGVHSDGHLGANEVWFDTLHLTPHGYDMLGSLVSTCVQSLLEARLAK
jgi:lysophospholipase L1-like esterase